MECKKCGQSIDINFKFCSSCGEPVVNRDIINDVEFESNRFRFKHYSKFVSTVTEVICKEDEINIMKIKTFIFSKKKMNRDFKYSEIKSLEYKNSLSTGYCGLGVLCTILTIKYYSIYNVLSAIYFFIRSFERVLYINNGEIKIKDSSIIKNKFIGFISIIEKRSNILAKITSKKQNIINCTIKICMGLFIMISLYEGSVFLEEWVKGKEYIDIVKSGSFNNYPNIEVGEAFENYFKNPKWKYFISDNDSNVVEFTGECMYDNAEVTALIQFIIDDNSGFEAKYFSMNNVSQNLLTMYGIIEAVMEDSNFNKADDELVYNTDDELVYNTDEVLEESDDNYNYYEPTPLGNEFFVTTNDLNYDMDEKKLIKSVLESKFAGCEDDIKSCLEKAMDDLEYDCTSAELGDEIRITGYHEEQEAKLSITISVVSNRSVIYLNSIYMNNRGINMEDQILFARDIFK